MFQFINFYETDGNIIWKSTKFVEELINIDIGNYLDEIIKEERQEIDLKKGKNIAKQIAEELNVKESQVTATIKLIDARKYNTIYCSL